jgi:hypothetical protein
MRIRVTEDGMQIDSKASEPSKAYISIVRRFESDSNPTLLSLCFQPQQNIPRYLIVPGIRMDSGEPTTSFSQCPSRSIKHPFWILNETEPFSISIDLIPLFSKALGWIVVTEAGITRKFKDLHKPNAR